MKYKPFINLGPGDTVREELAHYGWEQKDLAEVLGRSEKNVSQLITNKVPVNYETACQLSKVFKQSPQFWLNLDANYRQRLQESAKVQETEARALIYRYMPIRDLRKYMDMPSRTEDLISAVKAFWGIETLNFDFLEQQVAVSFRKSESLSSFNPYYALSWLQLTRNVLKECPQPATYDAKKLAALAGRIPEYTIKEFGVQEFIQELGSCGVAFLQLDHFQQTYTDGAAFFEGNTPVLIYTARYDRVDHFWFTITHEIGHILLHAENMADVFIDSMDHMDMENKREHEADAFANNILKSEQILAAFAGAKRHSTSKVLAVAHELGLQPAVVAGCLQHHGKASWKSFHALKQSIRTAIDSEGLEVIS